MPFFEAPYETVGMFILWQMTRFVTIRLAVGEQSCYYALKAITWAGIYS